MNAGRVPRRRRLAIGAAATVVLLPVTMVGLLSGGPPTPMFTDVATPELSSVASRSEGACFADVEGDGDQDLFVANREGGSRLYQNDGRGVFAEVGEAAGIRGVLERNLGCAFVDIDNDGDADLFVTGNNRSGSAIPSNRLLLNDGTGRFTDASGSAEVGMSPRVPAASADWADFDGDGDLDGFVAARFGWRANAFFEQVGRGRFRDIAAAKGLADPPGPQAAWIGNWFDYDGDGDVDLMLAIDFWGVELYRNDRGAFSRVTETALPAALDSTPGAPPDNPMGITWGDYDNDGCMDVFVTGANLTGQSGFEDDKLGDLASRLHHSNCNGTFTDVTERARFRRTGVPEWATNFIDFDNDGDLDLSVVGSNIIAGPLGPVVAFLISPFRRVVPYRLAVWALRYEAMIPAIGSIGPAAAMPNFLYQNLLVETGTARFVDRTYALGVGNVGAAVGSAWADIDGDGDLDWFIPNKHTPSRLFRNDGPVGNYLRVHLQGARIKSAVGAWLKIKVGTGWQMRHVHILDGYLSQSQLDPHFGLGQASLVDEVWVRWQGTTRWTRMCTEVPANRTITVTEGGGCT